ncbi:MAG: hypothetical protein IKR42_04235 [Campylobacter sp.]|nr:hypothetical protein [Campylobacter sp.]MBR4140969.1 hypothetical protein [Campylobacter sp.]
MKLSIKNLLLLIWLGVAALRAIYFYFTQDVSSAYMFGKMFGYSLTWPIRWIF